MGRKTGAKKVTNEQIREMMELRRRGKPITAIAEMLGLNRHTVSVYVKGNEDDFFRQEVRRGVMGEALRKHFEDLLHFADTELREELRPSYPEGLKIPQGKILGGLLWLPAIGSPLYMAEEMERMYADSTKTRHLKRALREHSEDSPLWYWWDKLQRERLADYVAGVSFFSRIVVEMESELTQKVKLEWIPSIQKWFFGNLLRKASGESYTELEVRGDELVYRGTLIARVKDGKAFNDYLASVLEKAEKTSEWTMLRLATADLAEKQEELRHIFAEMDSALDVLVLKRAFLGRCHLCPI